MKHIMESQVMYADTDSYKVVWHGNYLRWFEAGRYGFCRSIGVDLDELEKNGICFPVIDIHIQYKAPAKIFEEIIIETEISELKSRTIIFRQVIKNKKSGAILITADVTVVAVNTNTYKLVKLNEDLYGKFSNSKN